ncbi:MAG: glycosyltransferase family 39 protein [bacterium]
MTTKRRWLLVGLIVLLAAVLRLVFLQQFRCSDFYDCPVLDMRTYLEQAQAMARDGWHGLGVVWRPPLYPALLSLSLRFANNSLLPALLVQALLASVSAGLVYLIARRFVAEGISQAAAALYAINWMAIYFSAPLEGTSLFIFLLLLSLWLLMAAEGRRAWLLVPAGLAVGLSALVRTEVLPVVLVWALWMACRRRVAHALLVLAFAGITILPVAVHNYRMCGQFIPVTAIGGYNFFVGNNAQADGKTVWASAAALKALAVPVDLPPLENQSRYLKAAFGDIRKDPARFAGLLAKKAYYLINAHEIASNTDVYCVIAETSPMLAVLALLSFGILLPFAVVGVMFGNYDRRAAVPVFLFIIPFALVLLAFFVNARFRAPMIPFCCVFAALGAAAIWRERNNLLAGGRTLLLTLVLFLVLCNTRFFGVADPRDNLELYLHHAVAFHGRQRTESCRNMLVRVLDVDPQSKPAIYLWRQLP